MSNYKQNEKEGAQETAVVYSVNIPGGYTMTLTMNLAAEKTLRATFYSSEKGVTHTKAASLSETEDGKRIVQGIFAIGLLKQLIRYDTSEAVAPIKITGMDLIKIGVEVTNQKGNLANPRNLPQVIENMQTALEMRRTPEERENFGYIGTRFETTKQM